MARIPTSGRRKYDEDDDDLEEETRKKKREKRETLKDARAAFATQLLDQADAPSLGRPPKDDEEKRAVFRQLALLRSTPGNTYEMCAERLGVSRSTIGLWLREPLYKDVCDELYQDGKRQGFVSASALVADAFATLYDRMQNDPSGFVRMSSAKIILEHAGLTQPMQAAVADDVREVNRFLEQARQRGQQAATQVNVHISLSQQQGEPSAPVVDALPTDPLPLLEQSLFDPADQQSLAEQQMAMLAEYSQPLEPGGKLPGSVSPVERMRALQKLNEQQEKPNDAE
jgi:hypothetical protein